MRAWLAITLSVRSEQTSLLLAGVMSFGSWIGHIACQLAKCKWRPIDDFFFLIRVEFFSSGFKLISIVCARGVSGFWTGSCTWVVIELRLSWECLARARAGNSSVSCYSIRVVTWLTSHAWRILSACHRGRDSNSSISYWLNKFYWWR